MAGANHAGGRRNPGGDSYAEHPTLTSIMPLTLQRYIFREMGKTFLLAAVALTATMSLGGSVLKMVGVGELTPGQLLKLLVLIVPVSAALTLPIAALFSAAATYGRLAADNEFVACRSSGINLHVLFLPALILSVFSAGATFAFWNYMVPGVIEHLDELVAKDAASFIRRRLNQPRGIALGPGFRISADDVLTDPEHPERLILTDVVFVELQGEEWSRYGTARRLDVTIDLDASPTTVAARLVGVSFYDHQARRFVDLAEQTIPPTALPAMLPRQIKYLDLPSLVYYARHLDEWHQVRRVMDDLRVHVARRMVNDLVEDELHRRGFVSFEAGDVVITVRSDHRPARIPRDGGIEIVEATIEERRGERLVRGAASRAVIEVARGETVEDCAVEIVAYDVRLTRDDQSVSRSKETFGPAPLPRVVLDRVGRATPDELLQPIATRGDRDPILEKQAAARRERIRIRYDIIGTINERTAFSVSVLALVILAAALGIIFRGAHTIVAFGISFVPSVFVIVTIIMGKQMAQNVETHTLGLAILWGGIVLVSALDLWTLWCVLRR